MQLNKSEQFFYDHAGFSYDPRKETEDEGKIRCARELAAAEAKAIENGWHIDVTEDGLQYGWQRNTFDVVRNPETFRNKLYTGYDVTLYDQAGNAIANVGGVTFKDNNTHEPCRRCLFAELASEALEELEAKK